MIIQFDCELVLTYSWSNNNHGICGHTYEVIDYYFLLKNHFTTKILLAEDIDYYTFKKAITSKYDLTRAELDNILDNTIFHNRPKLLRGDRILFTDGGIEMINKYNLLFNEVFIFGCGDMNILDHVDKYQVLLDHRVYGEVGINYVKKVDLLRMKTLPRFNTKTLLYLTTNCRSIDMDILPDDNYYIISNEPIVGYEVHEPPVDNIFEQFDKYLYTPISRQFDCSPRFIAECAHYNKEVIYMVDYIDPGLQARISDIKEGVVQLEDDDPIINIIRR